MKRILITLLLSCSINAQIMKGVVIALEAPLYDRPSLEGDIVQYTRKNDIIKIHPLYNQQRMGDVDYLKETDIYGNSELVEARKEYIKTVNNFRFYKTLSRNGKEAFISKKYVKLIYNDDREYVEPINSYDPDKTDYRLAEPLSRTYPFYSASGYRAHVMLGSGSTPKESGKYQRTIKKSSYNPKFVFNVAMSSHVNFEKENRLYFGGQLQFISKSQEHTFEDNQSAEERNYQVGVGPYLSYDLIAHDLHRFTFFGSVLFNLIDSYTIEAATDSLVERADFSSMTISPMIGAIYQKREILPEIDFSIGASAQFHLMGELGLKSQTSNSTLLESSHGNYERERFPELNIFAGLQKAY